MNVYNGIGKQKGRKYGDYLGLLALAVVTLAEPHTSFAVDPTFTQPSPAGAGRVLLRLQRSHQD